MSQQEFSNTQPETPVIENINGNNASQEASTQAENINTNNSPQETAAQQVPNVSLADMLSDLKIDRAENDMLEDEEIQNIMGFGKQMQFNKAQLQNYYNICREQKQQLIQTQQEHQKQKAQQWEAVKQVCGEPDTEKFNNFRNNIFYGLGFIQQNTSVPIDAEKYANEITALLDAGCTEVVKALNYIGGQLKQSQVNVAQVKQPGVYGSSQGSSEIMDSNEQDNNTLLARLKEIKESQAYVNGDKSAKQQVKKITSILQTRGIF